MNNLEKMINPQSIAVIGASSDPAKVGFQLLNNIVESKFSGKVYPINPKGGTILDLKVYDNLSSVQDQVELAIIVVPAVIVPQVLMDCVEKKVSSVVIISAGFSEIGDEGKKLQEEIVKICKDNEINMMGPNCLGFVNNTVNLNASFASSTPKNGNVSFISQSGAMVSALIDWSNSSTVGFSKIFSMGNKADIDEGDVLDYLYSDDSTDVIIIYMEHLSVNDKLTDILIKNSKVKPTIVLFGGKSSFGAKAASSHTGSIVSSYLAVKTYLNEAGVIVVDGLNDLFTSCRIFSKYRKVFGDRFAVVTNAGGPSIATCDAIFSSGLKLAELSEETENNLKSLLPPAANILNPVDVLGDASEKAYEGALNVVLKDDSVDGIFVLLTPQSSTKVKETAEVIAKISSAKPIIPIFIGGEQVSSGVKIIEKSGIPSFSYPEEAVKAARELFLFSCGKIELERSELGDKTYSSDQKNNLMHTADLPVLNYFKFEEFDGLKAKAHEIGYPVVLKTAASDTAHKSDEGGVRLNIQNDDELNTAFNEIGSPVIIGKMIKTEKELFLGIKKEHDLGTVVAFGTGGIYSEIVGDFSYRVSPLSNEVAKSMILETRIGKIMNGARGQKTYDLDKLAEIIVNAAKFADRFTNIREIDFNPIIAFEDDYFIVDARIISS